jgi:hypothetical protein
MKKLNKYCYTKSLVLASTLIIILLITSLTFALTLSNVNSIANDIVRDVGIVKSTYEGANDKVLFVFEETHSSIIGQIEIAIMLNRLYKDYSMRYIGLEGFFSDKGQLIPNFSNNPPFKVGQNIRPREDTIVQLLESGEISSSEMIAMIYDDIKVLGIENESEHDYEPPETAWSACTIYLYKIAASNLTNFQILRHNELAKQDDIMPLIEYTVGTNEFTKNIYAKLNKKGIILSVEEHVESIDKIIEKAKQMNTDVTHDDKNNILALRKFFQIASDRSTTMINNTLSLFEKSSNSPLSMIIGAAHTEKTIKLLQEANISFTIIRSNSLEKNLKIGDLSSEEYNRKLKVLSVDPEGRLGALLDCRRKPETVLDQTWFQSKSNLYYLTTIIARSFDSGEQPPFKKTLDTIIPQLVNVTIDQNSIEVINGEVIFSVEVIGNNQKPIKLWVRTKKDKKLAARTLEKRLSESLLNVQDIETKPSNLENPTDPVLERVSSDTIAKYSTDPSAIRSSTISG